MHEDDQHHGRALEIADEFERDPRAEIVTSHAIFLEVLAYFSRKGPRLRAMAVDLVNRQLTSGSVYIVEVDSELLVEGLELYRRRGDKRYSLADCISMVIARAMDITEILTTDSDFEAEGFTILMPD